MEVKVNSCVYSADRIKKNTKVEIQSPLAKNIKINHPELIAYPPFINTHDHLISDWFPKAGFGHKYKNASQWVKEMVDSESVEERNKIWVNDGDFDLTDKNADLIIQLGIYKNICSGCAVVQDHIPNQKDSYYENTPITIHKEYAQCHSISMGNWWGGKQAREEWRKTEGKIPFIIHLAEGKDDVARSCFTSMRKQKLLQNNTLLIHGIALTREEIKQCAELGTSICWCPESNYFLIGETLDVESCLEFGTNVAIGTDSTMTGSLNILTEIAVAHKHFPQVAPKEIFKMITTNAKRALMLSDDHGSLSDTNQDILLIKQRNEDPFANLLQIDMHDIQLFVYRGVPLYGDCDFLKAFSIDENDYFFFGENRFVIGHPERTVNKIDQKLGYQKNFPFLPF